MSKRDTLRKELARRRKTVKAAQARIKKILAWFKKHPVAKPAAVPPVRNGWHPNAIQSQTGHGFGYRVNGGNKIVWHTTEGSSVPNYQLGWPHFTLDIKRKKLYQHIPITQAAQTLRNPAGGFDTNATKYATQIEIVGFARESHKWTDAEYKQLADLSRWIEKHTNTPRKCGVTFRSDSTHKVANYTNYEGHLGHQHVPENDHWDPGLLNIKKVLA